MSKQSNVKEMLPSAVGRALVGLGGRLRIARKRRKQSLSKWAERMQVSVPTLRKMEEGDPSVSVAAYATALWLAGQIQGLDRIADPALDEMALARELQALNKPRKKGVENE